MSETDRESDRAKRKAEQIAREEKVRRYLADNEVDSEGVVRLIAGILGQASRERERNQAIQEVFQERIEMSKKRLKNSNARSDKLLDAVERLMKSSAYLRRIVQEGQGIWATSLARKGASARHAENRALKRDVFEWLDENMPRFTSMDKAAEAIPMEVVPIAFRTARAWVGEWKKLRSASKA